MPDAWDEEARQIVEAHREQDADAIDGIRGDCALRLLADDIAASFRAAAGRGEAMRTIEQRLQRLEELLLADCPNPECTEGKVHNRYSHYPGCSDDCPACLGRGVVLAVAALAGRAEEESDG